MRHLRASTLHLLPAVIAIAALNGCATTRTDLVKAGVVSLAPDASLAHSPTISEQAGCLVVEGKLDANELSSGGHIDVVVTGPEGDRIFDAVVGYQGPAKRNTVSNRGLPGPRSTADAHSTYVVRFPGLPPAGSTVKVSKHAEAHTDTIR